MGSRCSHFGGPLDEGWVHDGGLVCPWHGSRFCLASGRVMDGPSTAPQPRYELHLMLLSHTDVGYTHPQPTVAEKHALLLDAVSSFGGERLDLDHPAIERLTHYIVGFELEIEQLVGRFKLSQDRNSTDQRLAAIELARRRIGNDPE